MDSSNNEFSQNKCNKKVLYYQCWVCRVCNRRLGEHEEYNKTNPHTYIKGIELIKKD
jgi:hypothetical protein